MAAHSICTRVGSKHRNLCMGDCNVTPLNGKAQELVWEAEQHHLDIVGVSLTKCRGSDTVELNEGWKLFYSGVDVTMSAQAGVSILVSPRLAQFVTDWIPHGGRVCLLKLRLQERSLFTHQTLKHSSSLVNLRTQETSLAKVFCTLCKQDNAESGRQWYIKVILQNQGPETFLDITKNFLNKN